MKNSIVIGRSTDWRNTMRKETQARCVNGQQLLSFLSSLLVSTYVSFSLFGMLIKLSWNVNLHR